MLIQETIEIRASLSVVWDVFSRLDQWNDWNSVCEGCALVDGDSFGQGVCFSFTLRPYVFPIKITPRVIRCEPGREVIWEGRRLGVHARHRFTFEEVDNGVCLHSVEEFAGALLWVSHLFFVPSRLHSLSRKLLQDIKAHSERLAGCHSSMERDSQDTR